MRVFYNNFKSLNGDIQSRVKGVNVYIDNNVWLQVVGLKSEGLFSHLPNSETNRWLKKRDAHKNWLRFPGRYTIERLYIHEGLNKEENMAAHILALIEGKIDNPHQQRVNSSSEGSDEESFDEDSMDMFHSD